MREGHIEIFSYKSLFSACGAFRDSKTWSTSGIEGVYRFLGRTWRLVVGSPLPNGAFRDGTVAINEDPSFEQLRSLHKCIAKVVNLSIYEFFFWYCMHS